MGRIIDRITFLILSLILSFVYLFLLLCWAEECEGLDDLGQEQEEESGYLFEDDPMVLEDQQAPSPLGSEEPEEPLVEHIDETAQLVERVEDEMTVESAEIPMIYGSPEAELYFHQHQADSALPIEVDDLSDLNDGATELVVRPLSPTLPSSSSSSQSTVHETGREASSLNLDDEEELYTEEEDEDNKMQAAARVASVLNDVHRPTGEENDLLDERAERMAEAILASAMFETVFLQPDMPAVPEVPFIGSSLCRIHIPSGGPAPGIVTYRLCLGRATYITSVPLLLLCLSRSLHVVALGHSHPARNEQG